MWADPATPTPCPFNDAYYFRYTDHVTGSCDQTISYAKPCVGHTKYLLHFKRCTTRDVVVLDPGRGQYSRNWICSSPARITFACKAELDLSLGKNQKNVSKIVWVYCKSREETEGAAAGCHVSVFTQLACNTNFTEKTWQFSEIMTVARATPCVICNICNNCIVLNSTNWISDISTATSQVCCQTLSLSLVLSS